jgi:hypothetical protein
MGVVPLYMQRDARVEGGSGLLSRLVSKFGLRIQGLGFRNQGLGFRFYGLGFGVQDLGFSVQGLWLRV